MFSSGILSTGALLLYTVNTALATLSANPKPIPPSKDPWYTAPSDYKSKQPGEILRFRQAPGNATSIFTNSSAVYNILFRTIDSHYQPFWAVTTLLVPKHSNVSALLSYQIPYNTPDVDGSPSYLLDTDFGSTGLIYSDIQTALGYGWYVNVPDFEGPLASFTELVQEGAAVLDSIRAVLNQSQGPAKDARYALWGYSGGSFASGSAAEIQGAYAPELDIAGVALGGWVPKWIDLIYNSDSTMFAGLVPATILGITSQFPAARQYLMSKLKSGFKAKFLKSLHLPIEPAFAYYNGTNVLSYFTDGGSILQAPTLQKLFHQHSTLGYHGIPNAPLYIYKAIHDELSPVSDSDTLVQRYCGVDVNILYERNTVGGHVAEETNGDGRALAWLNQALSGTYDHTGCTVKNVTISVDTSPY